MNNLPSVKMYLQKNLFFWGLVLLLGACASRQRTINERPIDQPYSFIFPAPYDTVWNATLEVVEEYPLAKAESEAGELESDFIPYRYNSDLFDHPTPVHNLEEIRYKIKIILTKGLVRQTGEHATRVQIYKELWQYKNFFLDWTRVPTDGLEEQVLLYRIGQRLKIAQELKRKRTGAPSSKTKLEPKEDEEVPEALKEEAPNPQFTPKPK